MISDPVIEKERSARLYGGTSGPEDLRNPYKHDSDRILYSRPWRRLADITQVVGAEDMMNFSNRQTHSQKVARIGRRVAEYLLAKLEKDGRQDDLLRCGGLNADVIEAAGMAHDLGHPPFGHIGEYCLNDWAKGHQLDDGYEGNAQSFRIVSHICVHGEEYSGINLARATLNAMLKYPWSADEAQRHKLKKWGYYKADSESFDFARKMVSSLGSRRTLEAEIMDYADDIAYSVYDFEDFGRKGIIPVNLLFGKNGRDASAQRNLFFDELMKRKPEWETRRADLDLAFNNLGETIYLQTGYDGSRRMRLWFQTRTSFLVNAFVSKLDIDTSGDNFLTVNPSIKNIMDILKQLVWHYVIESPSVKSCQISQRRMLSSVLDLLFCACRNHDRSVIGYFGQESEELIISDSKNRNVLARAVLDFVSQMTEMQVMKVFKQTSDDMVDFDKCQTLRIGKFSDFVKSSA